MWPLKQVMKQSISIIFLLSLIFASCSGSETTTIVTSDNQEFEVPVVVGNRLLTLEIEGMTCVMGCGGLIRSELAETKAIESCEFDFENGRKRNVAKIAFDKDKITVDEIISIVANLNEGQFAVGNNSTENISVNINTTVEEVKKDNIDEGKMKVSSQSAVELPNFVEILASFFHN